MALSSQSSFLLSTLLVVLLFSGMQANRHWLSATPFRTILSGFMASLLFVFSLTSVGNIELLLFGKDFQTQLFPEVLTCLALTLSASALIHRVTVTTAIIFSTMALYYMNNLSQKQFSTPTHSISVVVGKKKKH